MRTREEIEQSATDSLRAEGYDNIQDIKLEVLLDIRDILLNKQNDCDHYWIRIHRPFVDTPYAQECSKCGFFKLL